MRFHTCVASFQILTLSNLVNTFLIGTIHHFELMIILYLQADNLRIAGLPADTEINPYVKAFLVPGRTFKYRTKTIPKTKVRI